MTEETVTLILASDEGHWKIDVLCDVVVSGHGNQFIPKQRPCLEFESDHLCTLLSLHAHLDYMGLDLCAQVSAGLPTVLHPDQKYTMQWPLGSPVVTTTF